LVNVGQFQLGSLSMEPVKHFNAALSTIFDHVIHANNELRQQVMELKTDRDRLAADRADALKVCFASFSTFFFHWVCTASFLHVRACHQICFLTRLSAQATRTMSSSRIGSPSFKSCSSISPVQGKTWCL